MGEVLSIVLAVREEDRTADAEEGVCGMKKKVKAPRVKVDEIVKAEMEERLRPLKRRLFHLQADSDDVSYRWKSFHEDLKKIRDAVQARLDAAKAGKFEAHAFADKGEIRLFVHKPYDENCQCNCYRKNEEVCFQKLLEKLER